MEATSLEFSIDSKLYSVVDAGGVTIYAAASHTTEQRIECPGVQVVAFSPLSTFITTFQRPLKNADGISERNLRVWSISSGAQVLALHQKTLNRDQWPSVQFTGDDSLAIYQVTNTLHAYDTLDFAAGPKIKFPIKGVAGFAVSPTLPLKDNSSSAPVVVAYVPEAKGSPGHVALYHLKSSPQGAPPPTPLTRRSFFRTNSVRFFWSSTGEAVLALTAADVDATNQSYYGEQKLFFFAADGNSEMAVPLPKEGPIHDVQWSPDGKWFATVAGFMPAKSTLFTSACVPKFDLGSGPYSLVRWNPFGRFLVLAGFGNLPGDLAFFDRKADGKCKPMGTSRAENGVTLEWSPCGRYVLAATVAPRLRVDNGFQVFKYDGTLMARAKRPVLFQASWQPATKGTFEDKPQTPRSVEVAEAPEALPPQPIKAAGYIPPHLRNNPAAAAAAKASFSLARDPNDRGGKIPPGKTVAVPTAASNLPPGAAPPMSKAASKNAKRRSKKKADGAES